MNRLLPAGGSADEGDSMSVPPPTSSFAPPSGANSLREFPIALEAERSWKRRRAGEDLMRLSALGATLEHERMLRAPLKLPLGMLQIGIVERGASTADGRFPILRRLSATAVVPREHGIEGWLWTRSGGSAMTTLGDPALAPNAALLFTKPLGEDHLAAFAEESLAEIAAHSPLGEPAVYGLLFRVTDQSHTENVFRQFGLLRPLTDREIAPTLRRSLPGDRSADPGLVAAGDDTRAATSVAPPGMA
jgi:hypothetical protein